jgi:hypothetical protein
MFISKVILYKGLIYAICRAALVIVSATSLSSLQKMFFSVHVENVSEQVYLVGLTCPTDTQTGLLVLLQRNVRLLWFHHCVSHNNYELQ